MYLWNSYYLMYILEGIPRPNLATEYFQVYMGNIVKYITVHTHRGKKWVQIIFNNPVLINLIFSCEF